MKKYLNKLNAGMFICDKFETGNEEPLKNICGIKNKLILDKNNKTSFSFVCDLSFIEFEIPEQGGDLSFRFYIRTLGGEQSYIIPFLVTEMHLVEGNEGVMTRSLPMMIEVPDFEFPRTGEYAIELYYYFGKIDHDIEKSNRGYYRIPDNFVNALMFHVNS